MNRKFLFWVFYQDWCFSLVANRTWNCMLHVQPSLASNMVNDLHWRIDTSENSWNSTSKASVIAFTSVSVVSKCSFNLSIKPVWCTGLFTKTGFPLKGKRHVRRQILFLWGAGSHRERQRVNGAFSLKSGKLGGCRGYESAKFILPFLYL